MATKNPAFKKQIRGENIKHERLTDQRVCVKVWICDKWEQWLRGRDVKDRL